MFNLIDCPKFIITTRLIIETGPIAIYGNRQKQRLQKIHALMAKINTN